MALACSLTVHRELIEQDILTDPVGASLEVFTISIQSSNAYIHIIELCINFQISSMVIAKSSMISPRMFPILSGNCFQNHASRVYNTSVPRHFPRSYFPFLALRWQLFDSDATSMFYSQYIPSRSWRSQCLALHSVYFALFVVLFLI